MNDQVEGHPASGKSVPMGGAPTSALSRGQDSISQNSDMTATASDIREKISDDVRSAAEFTKQEIANVTDKAKEAADQQKNFLADKVSSVAQAMEKVAEELEQGENQDIGKMTRTLGSNVRKFSDDIQGRSLSEIAGMAEDFGRKQPLAFLGLAAIAGLAASRFLTASAPRSNGSFDKPTPSESAAPMTEGRVDG